MAHGIIDATQPFASMPNGGTDAAAGADPLAVALVLVAYLALTAGVIAASQPLWGKEVPA